MERSIWRAAPSGAAEETLRKAGVPPRLAPLLARRGADDAEGAHAFLNPTLDQFHDPFLLHGLDRAVERLALAQQLRHKVAVVGDYDVDGVTATALLLAVLGNCGVEAIPILPHRLQEGYGFQPVHVDKAMAAGCQLIVTVDCGTSALAAVEHALGAGVDVVITDHHLPGEGMPVGAVVVNPRQDECAYPFPHLSGVGLALKLALGLAQRLGREIPIDPLLRMACLGTIADLVPLVGENRVIAARGLSTFGETRSAGLRALMEKAGVRPPLRASDVGFRLGPRLNAAGRLASPDQALQLLLSRDQREASGLAEQLESANRARQEEEMHVVTEATALVVPQQPRPYLLMEWNERWHRGVIGIAAGRLARDFCRPTILFAIEGELATGSGRSVPGLDLHALVRRFGERCERFGGHAQAIGLTVRVEALEDLRAALAEAASELPPELFVPRFEYELSLAAGDVSLNLLAELARLEPFGVGNPQPLVRVGNLSLAEPPRLFGQGHLSAVAVDDDGDSLYLLGWRWRERAAELGGRFEALGYVETDSYRGDAVLRLADVRPA